MIVIFYGRGNNGKTSFTELLRRLIGPGQIYSGRVDDLEKNQFSIGNLFGKLVFIDDDIKAGTKLPDGTLKKISEAKTLTGERKFKDPFEFKSRAFPILLCNNIPSLADLSYGMMRRLQVVPFAQIFKEHETDRQLFERIAANELSGVLNRALAGWKRLHNKGRFTRSWTWPMPAKSYWLTPIRYKGLSTNVARRPKTSRSSWTNSKALQGLGRR